MPEMIPLGWFHTIMGATALLSGLLTLYRYKEIKLQTQSGRVYLITTLLTAVTALFIFQRGEFGPGHALAVLTLAAFVVGTLAATTGLFGKFSRYVQALGYSSTLLFHCIPAITDALLRLPVGDPVLDSINSPVLKTCYLVLLILFLIGITLQLRWLHRQESAA